jgi:hypothetical protein
MRRSELEQWHTLKEMEGVIKDFFDTTPRNGAFARRVGLGKDMAEEYVPLCILLRNLPSISHARLSPKSHGGPDADLRSRSGQERSIQITLAGASDQTYFNRQAALLRKPFFPSQKKTYNKRTGSLTASGRVLQAPAGVVRDCAGALVKAVENKQHDYSGTDYLLVVYEPSVLPRRLRTDAMRAIKHQLAIARTPWRFRKIFALIGDVVEQVAGEPRRLVKARQRGLSASR